MPGILLYVGFLAELSEMAAQHDKNQDVEIQKQAARQADVDRSFARQRAED